MLRSVVLAALILTASAGARTAPPVISVSPPVIRLGAYRLDQRPTYAGAQSILGGSTSCMLVGGDVSHARAAWAVLGLVIELRTYGALPAGKTACSAPRVMKIHTVRVTGHRWVTARGVRVGDSVDYLKKRYPSARAARPLTGWYARGYWLVTRHVGGYEGIGGLKPDAPVLVAETRDGRITAFVVVVDAEGD
jgi:hypothetical protein